MQKLLEILNSVGENVWAAFFALLGCAMGILSISHREIFPAATALISMGALAFKGDRSR